MLVTGVGGWAVTAVTAGIVIGMPTVAVATVVVPMTPPPLAVACDCSGVDT